MSVMYRGPVVIRRRLGFVLKQLRTAKGYGLDVVAKNLEMSPAKLSRLEGGQVAPKIRDVRDLLEEYDAPPELREELLQLASDAKDQGWWQPSGAVDADLNLYISLETEAHAIKIYGLAVPALLQTEAYARMIHAGVTPQKTAAQQEELVRILLRRQGVLSPDREKVDPLQLHAIIDEAALRRGPAKGPLMAEQMRALLHRSELPNITIQVLPFSACYTPAMSTFSIIEPRERSDWPVAWVESAARDDYFDSRLEISRYGQVWQEVIDKALTPAESLSIISAAAQEWEQAAG